MDLGKLFDAVIDTLSKTKLEVKANPNEINVSVEKENSQLKIEYKNTDKK